MNLFFRLILIVTVSLPSVLHAQRSLKQIKKSIPNKKVKNVRAIDDVKDHYYFESTGGFNIWDDENRKVVITSLSRLAAHDLDENFVVMYSADTTYLYAHYVKKIFSVSAFEDEYQKLSDNRFRVKFYDSFVGDLGQLEFSDTLMKLYCTIRRNDKNVFSRITQKGKSFKSDLIDIKSQEIVLSSDKWNMSPIKNGYVGQYYFKDDNADFGDYELIYYNQEYEQQGEPVIKSEIDQPDVFASIVNLPIDSIIRFEYEDGFYFSSEDKWGAFNPIKGMIMEPSADLLLPMKFGYAYLKNNKLGLISPIGPHYYPAVYNSISTYEKYCDGAVKADDDYFYPTYWSPCELFAGLVEWEIKEVDSLLMYLLSTEALSNTEIIGDRLFHSIGYREYHTGPDSPTEYDWWYTQEGQSGVYSLSQNKWLIQPIHHNIESFGSYYIVCPGYVEDFGPRYHLLDEEFSKLNDQVYTNVFQQDNQLFLRDTITINFKMNLSGEITQFDSTFNGMYPEFSGEYLTFGERYYDNEYDKEDYTTGSIFYLDENLNKLEGPDSLDVIAYCPYKYGVLTHHWAKFHLYDFTTGKIVKEWNGGVVEVKGNFVEVDDGYGNIRLRIDLEALRNEEE